MIKTENQYKRDKYKALYDKLSDLCEKAEKERDKALDSLNMYNNEVPEMYVMVVPYANEMSVPAKDYEDKRILLTENLNKEFEYVNEKIGDLKTAKNVAYQKYIEYDDLSMKEND